MEFDKEAINAACFQYSEWAKMSGGNIGVAMSCALSAAFQSMKERGKLPLSALEGECYEHRKGGHYVKVGIGKIQTTQPLADMAEVVIYRSEKDGSLWARDKAEFEDGRFRLVPVEG